MGNGKRLPVVYKFDDVSKILERLHKSVSQNQPEGPLQYARFWHVLEDCVVDMQCNQTSSRRKLIT